MSSIVSQGLDLAIYGMGSVFFFLTVLVLATMLMSKLTTSLSVTINDTSIDNNSKKKMAAIAAAIHLHRTQQ